MLQFKYDIVSMKTLQRITIEPEKMGGTPCIRGLRIPVATIVGMIAAGMTHQEILKEFPDLEPEDIKEALLFAAQTLKERAVPVVL